MKIEDSRQTQEFFRIPTLGRFDNLTDVSFWVELILVRKATQNFGFRTDSPLSAEECKFVILKSEELKCSAAVRRVIATKFVSTNPRRVPVEVNFHRVIDRFLF